MLCYALRQIRQRFPARRPMRLRYPPHMLEKANVQMLIRFAFKTRKIGACAISQFGKCAKNLVLTPSINEKIE